MADLIEREPLLEKMFPSQQKRLVEEAPAVNRWIPCSEMLPERGFVLVFDANTGAYYIARRSDEYDGTKDCWYDEFCCVLNFGVTHWTPLPEPPMNGGNQE